MPPSVASAKPAKLEKALLRRSTYKVPLTSKGEEFPPFARGMPAQENIAMAGLGLGREDMSGILRCTALAPSPSNI